MGWYADQRGYTMVCNLQDEDAAADAVGDAGGSATDVAGVGAAKLDRQCQVIDQAGRYNAGKQRRKIYGTALAQLHQQQEMVLVGAAAKLLAWKQLVAAMGATVACGVLSQWTRARDVVDVTRAAPVRDVVIDMCAGKQSMKGPARKQGYRYVAVEIDAVIRPVRGMQRADVVLDLRQVTVAELLAVVARMAGVRVAEILLVWASVPCNTMSRLNPGALQGTTCEIVVLVCLLYCRVGGFFSRCDD